MTPLEVINPGTISQQTQNIAPSVRAPGACVHRHEQPEANESVAPGRTQYASHGSAPPTPLARTTAVSCWRTTVGTTARFGTAS
jgi:hypothetical protein